MGSRGVHSSYRDRMSEVKKSPERTRQLYESIKKDMDIARLEGMIRNDAMSPRSHTINSIQNIKSSMKNKSGEKVTNPTEMRRLL